MATAVAPHLEAFKKAIDRTLIREDLKLSHEQCLLKLMQLQRFAQELCRAGRRTRRDGKEISNGISSCL